MNKNEIIEMVKKYGKECDSDEIKKILRKAIGDGRLGTVLVFLFFLILMTPGLRICRFPNPPLLRKTGGLKPV